MDEDDKWAQKARLRLGALKKSIDDDEDLQDARNMSLAARLNRARPSQASQPDDDDDDEDLQEAIGTRPTRSNRHVSSKPWRGRRNPSR